MHNGRVGTENCPVGMHNGPAATSHRLAAKVIGDETSHRLAARVIGDETSHRLAGYAMRPIKDWRQKVISA